MIDICRNNRAAPRNFVTHELGSDVFGNGCTEGFPRMLEAKVGTIIAGGFIRLFASQVLANSNELHLGRDDPFARVRQLSNGQATSGFSGRTLESRKRFQPHPALALRRVFEAQITVVFRAHGAAFIFDGIASVENPLEPKRAHALLYIAKLVRITPGPARVVYPHTSPVLGQDLSQRYLDGTIKFALDVDALAGRKSGIEVGGILEFEFGTTHSLLPSSALSESGSRGRSLMDPLSPEKLPRERFYVLNTKRTTATASAGNIRISELETGAMQPLDVIDLGSVHIKEACLIDKYLQPIKLKYGVALVIAVFIETHTVLETGATPTGDLNTQAGIRFRLFGKNFLYLVFSFLGQYDCHSDKLLYLASDLLFLLRPTGLALRAASCCRYTGFAGLFE